jgi:glycosyltransferase involved in cell wall biosynthesis
VEAREERVNDAAAIVPAISVCIPTYNGAAFLAETLSSVAAQTFRDFEVLIVDDGSSDDTLAIAERFAATEPRARVIRNAERAGSSAGNANRAAGHACGEWIKFLFQDDVMAPTCLARMLDAGQRGPLVIAWHDYLFAPDVPDGVRQYYETLPTIRESLPAAYANPDEVCVAVVRHLGINFIGPTSSSFVRRDCFERYGGFTPEVAMFPDLEFWMRVGSHEGLSIVREPLVSFRVHNRSISAQLREDSGRAFWYQLQWVLTLLLMARSPAYENFRQFARRCDPPFDARALLAREAFDARWVALDAHFRGRDETLFAQWTALCERHPEMRDVMHDIDAGLPLWTRVRQFVKARL